MDTLSLALSLKEEFFSLREHLHQHPELGNQEYQTASFLEAYLKGLGIPTKRVLDTAVIGTLKGAKEGPVVALRADMDALPLEEATHCAFASQNPGVMHACGHDIHMTAALGAARILSEHREELQGTILFVFQPDEEGSGGARRILETGILCDVEAFYGGHVDPNLPLGTIGIRYGKFYAASDVFTVTVHGIGTHGATPEKGKSALLAAVDMIHALSLLKPSSKDRAVLSIGTLHSGNRGNILPEEAVFSGILRTLGPADRTEMKKLLQETLEQVAQEHGVSMNLDLRSSYGGIVNTENETARLEEAAKETFGDEKVVRLTEPTMTTEDFGYYVDAAAGSFCHLGAGCSLPLHNPAFLPDGMAAVYGAALYAKVLVNALQKT